MDTLTTLSTFLNTYKIGQRTYNNGHMSIKMYSFFLWEKCIITISTNY